MWILRFLGTLLDRLCVVVGAFIGSQVPAFMLQYTQRLSGHVDELEHVLDQLRKVASFSNKTLEEYIQKFISSSDIDFARQGEFMHSILERWETLSTSLLQFKQATLWSRPFVFAQYVNYDIARATLHDFQPAVTLTIEGLCYTAAGFLFGYLVYLAISTLFKIGSSHAVSLFKQTA